jgi:hypothetical protein
MKRMTLNIRHVRQRNILFFTSPHLWPVYPFLPLTRHSKPSELKCGLLFDLKGIYDLYGFSSTVWICNFFTVPQCLNQFLSLPRFVYDTAEELFDSGWRVD